MDRKEVNPQAVSPAIGGYCHGIEVGGPALTVVVAGTLDSKWLLEIEAVAAA